MKIKQVPLLLWALGAGLWGVVIAGRSMGEDSVAVASEPDVATVQSDTGLPPAGAAAEAGRTGGTAAPERRSNGACVDINRADERELDRLPGVGPAIARRIIDYRTAHGSYAALADLDAVKGIGPAMLAKLEGRVCF